MGDTNKVKFGIDSCYYSVITENLDGSISYATPVAFPGAVSLSLDPENNDPEPFYADNIIYYQTTGGSNGYSGDFEVAKVPDSFLTDVLGMVTDENGMMLEDADSETKRFALLAQFSGDKHKTRHVWYNCTATRPASGSSTIEETATPQTESITITAIPATFGDRHIVKAKVTPDATVPYTAFFATVQEPDFGEEVSA